MLVEKRTELENGMRVVRRLEGLGKASVGLGWLLLHLCTSAFTKHDVKGGKASSSATESGHVLVLATVGQKGELFSGGFADRARPRWQ